MFSKKSTQDRIVRSILNDEGHLFMAYQPKINLETMQVDSFEALLRWRENGAYLQPQEVLRSANQAGNYIAGCLLSRISARVVQDIANMPPEKRLPVAINIDPDQLSRPYLDFLVELTEREQISLSLLELEVTEHMPYGEMESFRRRVDEIQSFGVNVWLDDFGQGYASLSALAAVGVHGVKLDSSFSKNCRSDLGGALFESVVSMCQRQRFKIVVEGIESEHEHNLAVNCACDFGQGYFYGRPEITAIESHSWFQRAADADGASSVESLLLSLRNAATPA